ncbi:MAG: hypothetical protein GOU98_00770 [Candidatus Altiarchaeota archaeon]|nr:hypothetical protein [Candidatus Altiarchaeota archaeon]
MNLEFALVIFVYMFIINFVMKKAGGVELREIEKDVKKLLKQARAGDEKALKKLNKTNSKRMKLAMRGQLYLLPIVIPSIFFIKSRYIDFQWTIFGHTFGWLGSFLILGIPASMVADKIVKKLLKYS